MCLKDSFTVSRISSSSKVSLPVKVPYNQARCPFQLLSPAAVEGKTGECASLTFCPDINRGMDSPIYSREIPDHGDHIYSASKEQTRKVLEKFVRFLN